MARFGHPARKEEVEIRVRDHITSGGLLAWSEDREERPMTPDNLKGVLGFQLSL